MKKTPIPLFETENEGNEAKRFPHFHYEFGSVCSQSSAFLAHPDKE